MTMMIVTAIKVMNMIKMILIKAKARMRMKTNHGVTFCSGPLGMPGHKVH